MMSDDQIRDLAMYVIRTPLMGPKGLDDRDKLRLAYELICRSDIPTRPEVTAYLRDAFEGEADAT
jgi:hypothetical protein